MHLEQLLQLSAQTVVSDKRDLVYGFLGLIEPSLAKSIKPDYTLDARSVYTWTAKAAIGVSNNLEILRHCNPLSGNVPTRVPDWTWPRPRGSQLHRQFDASKGLQMEASFLEFSGLRCKGIILDKVSGFTVRRRASNEPGGLEYAVNSGQFPEQAASAYGEKEATRTALRCALAAATDDPEDPKHEAIFHIPWDFNHGLPQFKKRGWIKFVEQREFYFKWAEWFQSNAKFPIGNQILEDFFNPRNNAMPADASYEDCCESYDAFIHIIQGRRFSVSSKEYFGWIPESMRRGDEYQVQVGDLFCTISGCSMPIILRECGRFYKVIGEGYLQGYMEGQAVEILESGLYQSEDFIIR